MSLLDHPPLRGATEPAELTRAVAAQMDALPLSRPQPAQTAGSDTFGAGDTASGVQPLFPTMDWNWRPAAIGTTDPGQYHLLDTMPVGTDTRTQYEPSGVSMSQGYASFVDLLTTFPDPHQLERVRAALTRPTTPPADTPSPPGWTKVTDGSGILGWQLDWIATQTPNEWLAGIAGASQPPTTLRFSLREVFRGAVPAMPTVVMAATHSSSLRPVPLHADELRQLEITARAWGRVNVYPGSWYDHSIVVLGRHGPFRGNVPAADVLGPDGVLWAQVTGLLVAADPQVTLTVDNAYAQRNADRLRAATSVQLAGWQFDDTAAGEPLLRLSSPGPGTTTLTAAAPAGAPPQIAGVYVRPLG